MSSNELSNVMQHLGEAIAKLAPRDYQLLLANKATISIVVTPTADMPVKSEAIGPSDLMALVQRLDESPTRDQGAALLKALNKAQLQALAKHISVSIDSGASKDRFIEKIVERRVGLRLRQDAFAQAMHAN